jgi:hypothetical protein
MDEHNAEKEMESAENVLLLQNAYNGDRHFVRKKSGLIINKSSRVIDR